ncbi:MAG: hypothetical protein KY461_16120 [Actinobacteria bacterium]|nr:hypothetical protein [Actinomycetota bacterium]
MSATVPVVPIRSATEASAAPTPTPADAAPDRPRGEPRRFALLDALDRFPLAPPVAAARELVDRVANVRVGEDGITLTGIWSRRIAWEHIDAVELSSRLDELLTLGLGFTPLGRIPKLHRMAESAVLTTAERLAPLRLSRARDRAGWTVVRIHQQRRSTELRRLPALVAHLYPETTRTILDVARRRGIEVVHDTDA